MGVYFLTLTLTAGGFTAPWAVRMHGASFESPTPEAIAVYLEKGMTILLSLVISDQMDPIYIELIC